MLITIEGVLRELPLPSSMTSEPSGRASAARRPEMNTGLPDVVVSTLPRLARVSLARLVIEQRPQIGALITVRAPDQLRVRIVDRHAAGARQQHLDELREGRVATGGWAVRGRADRHGICLNEQAGVPLPMVQGIGCENLDGSRNYCLFGAFYGRPVRKRGGLRGGATTLRGSARSTLVMSST